MSDIGHSEHAGGEGAGEIDARRAIALARAGGARLVDVREQHEWDAGHAPDAQLMPMSTFSDETALPEEPLLIVCHAGVRSKRVADALAARGVDATSVAGGMVAWAAAGGDVVSEDGSDPRVD